MQVKIELDVIDIMNLVRTEVARRYPGHDVVGLTVTSWNKPLFEIEDDMLTEPFRHKLDPDRAQLK